MTAREQLLGAARTLAAERLVTAFGHVSARLDDGTVLVTPPRPLGALEPDDTLPELRLDDIDALPADVPGEGWIHWAIYRSRPDVGGVCRAQPETATALAAAGVSIRALHGHGAFLGREVALHDDARLIRSRELGEAVAVALGNSSAVLLRGNGAVTVGANVEEAVTRMWVLEASARINRDAGPDAPALSERERAAWESVAPEMLARIWAYLAEKTPAGVAQ